MSGNVLLGVTGGIAAYKAADIVSRLIKQDVNVDVIMTKYAQEFITPMTFQSLSGNKTVTDMFDTSFTPDIEHISLAKKADVILIAPATANIIAKIAHGIADDMLTTVVLASKAKLIMAPAMNTVMYEAEVTQNNIKTLKERGVIVIDPVEGLLACNDLGRGKMEEPENIVEAVLYHLTCSRDLEGKKVLITAGPTRESVDPVRFITNRSTGKMGYEMAREAKRRGADVTLVSGRVNLKAPYGVNLINIESAQDMYEEVMKRAGESDIIIKSAAVADYTPQNKSNIKIKKQSGNIKIELERTHDILFEVGQAKTDQQILVGFAAETNDVIENAKSKMQRKNLDFIIANDVKKEGAGFGTDTNIVTIIPRQGEIEPLPVMKKSEVARAVFDRILKRL